MFPEAMEKFYLSVWIFRLSLLFFFSIFVFYSSDIVSVASQESFDSTFQLRAMKAEDSLG